MALAGATRIAELDGLAVADPGQPENFPVYLTAPAVDAFRYQAYRGDVRMVHRAGQQSVTLVTDAQRPMSEDIAYRERRYLMMMGFRVACFLGAIALFAAHAGWFAGDTGGRRHPRSRTLRLYLPTADVSREHQGLRHYEPNLPTRYSGPCLPPSRSATGERRLG